MFTTCRNVFALPCRFRFYLSYCYLCRRKPSPRITFGLIRPVDPSIRLATGAPAARLLPAPTQFSISGRPVMR